MIKKNIYILKKIKIMIINRNMQQDLFQCMRYMYFILYFRVTCCQEFCSYKQITVTEKIRINSCLHFVNCWYGGIFFNFNYKPTFITFILLFSMISDINSFTLCISNQ